MLRTLNIRNYRNLRSLQLSGIARVNLITGKNNTGKSTLLEAIALYASKADLALIYDLLEERGENFKSAETSKDVIDSNLRALSSLFTNRLVSFRKEDAIYIGVPDNTLFGPEETSFDAIALRFLRYVEELKMEGNGNVLRRTNILELEDDVDHHFKNYKIGFQLRASDASFTIPLEEERRYRYFKNANTEKERFQFIRTRNIDRDSNGKLWDNITLTDKEQFVIEALKIIEPTTERIAFIEEGSKLRTAVIKLADNTTILPLRSMGDGINRILTIILALVNASGGYLLLDEFENGLHYTVQQKLWEVIFRLSALLDIQVFATTHSEDCISSFTLALDNLDEKSAGKLIRLDNTNGEIRQVEYSANELKIANDQNIETR